MTSESKDFSSLLFYSVLFHIPYIYSSNAIIFEKEFLNNKWSVINHQNCLFDTGSRVYVLQSPLKTLFFSMSVIYFVALLLHFRDGASVQTNPGTANRWANSQFSKNHQSVVYLHQVLNQFQINRNNNQAHCASNCFQTAKNYRRYCNEGKI